jgi:hypothetical protein
MTHARETRSVDSHCSLVIDRRKGARDPLSKGLGAEKEWNWGSELGRRIRGERERRRTHGAKEKELAISDIPQCS